ncbi:MAG: hypothetical protein AVDCRST_MAG52-1990, partial [uncultured Blastococcus sp.]
SAAGRHGCVRAGIRRNGGVPKAGDADGAAELSRPPRTGDARVAGRRRL